MRAAQISGVTAALLLVGGAALPAEWRLNGDISQGFTVAENPDIEVESDGVAYGATTSLGFQLNARSGRTLWQLGARGGFSAFGGEASDTDLNEPTANVGGGVSYRGRRFNIGGNLSYTRQPTDFLTLQPILLAEEVDVDDDGQVDFIQINQDNVIIERDSVRSTFGGGVSFSYSLTPTSSLNFSTSQFFTRYSENSGGLVDNDLFSASAGLDHQLTSATGLGFAISLRRLDADNFEQTDAMTVSATGSINTQLTGATRLDAGLGLSYSSVDELELRDDQFLRGTETTLSFSGNLRATYRRTDQTAFTVFASHFVRPNNNDGDLRNFTNFGGSFSHALTPLSQFSLTARHSISSNLGDGDGDLEQGFILSPSLSYRLTQNWSASVDYTFRLINDDSGTAFGNRVFLSFSRGFALYP